jgi:SpoVK/Ycf46/Vps4 family AAA+-type ATPase
MEAIDADYGALSGAHRGETEKNLKLLFERASDEKKFLILNEGDSLLSRRDGVSQDWMRTEVNQMLRLMEKHDFPFVCTTNLVDSIDRAALRRFTFNLEFKPFPEAKAVEVFKQWFGVEVPEGRHLPRNVALGDFAKLSEQAAILGISGDATALLNTLEIEIRLKKERRPDSKLGFRKEVVAVAL